MPKARLESQKRIAQKRGLLLYWKTTNEYKNTDLERIWQCGSQKVSKLLKNPEKLTIEELMRMRLSEDVRLQLTKY